MLKKGQLLKSTLLISSILLVSLLALLSLLFHQTTAVISTHLTQLNGVFTLCRCGIYLLVFFLWPSWMHFLARRYQWPVEHLQYACQRRYFIFIGLVILELVLAQNIIGKLFTFLF